MRRLGHFHFSARGDQVAVLDNMAKRHWCAELGVAGLLEIESFQDRVVAWNEVSGKEIQVYVGDLQDHFPV